jgi:hypothetical protein
LLTCLVCRETRHPDTGPLPRLIAAGRAVSFLVSQGVSQILAVGRE